ncbi:esterase/lipase superfamily enzyme [Mycoplana sp. BE70]|uniref:alpha/beta hydrolase n=1 Tax=Mycoplana sp. BE70 TaxID=2817775 RepID=UPI0028604EEF|nr:alpha/beta hydrolase [Mycoplana sp. BE70]MDR6757886.1 esterase/lipase superfamily enzyme [Mycoplana sp. BE70]
MRCAWHVAVVLSLSVALAACGGKKGYMTPIAETAPVPGTSTVDMLVATTRLPSGDPNTLFSGERSAHPYLTDIAVSIPPASKRKVGSVQWPTKMPPDPATDFAVLRVEQLSSIEAGEGWFRAHNRNGHVMVFVHGFNNRYEDAVFRFAQIVHDSKADVTPVLFTWPSRARVFDYNYDKESTNYSRSGLERLLHVLQDDKGVKDITILAHSMGTWLAMESLRQMSIRDGRVAPKIENVVLASPDIDIDVFARQWSELGGKKPNFTIFVAQDDKALALSRFISGDIQRLGQINPADEPYRAQFEKAGITVVDLTKVKSGDRLAHGKFAESPQIVQLIGERLVNGQTLTDSNISLGEGITAVVAGTTGGIGRIAATTVATPIDLLTLTPQQQRIGGGPDRALVFDQAEQPAAPAR